MWIEDFAGRIQRAGGLETVFCLCLTSSSFRAALSVLSFILPLFHPLFCLYLPVEFSSVKKKKRKTNWWIMTKSPWHHISETRREACTNMHWLNSIEALCLSSTFQYHTQMLVDSCRTEWLQNLPDGRKRNGQKKERNEVLMLGLFLLFSSYPLKIMESPTSSH